MIAKAVKPTPGAMPEMDNNTEIERMKGLHAMSEAEYEQMMREQAPMMVGAQPWLEPEHLRQAQNIRLMNGDEPARAGAANLSARAEPKRPSWWRRRDWWRL